MSDQNKDLDRLDDISKFCALISEKTAGLTWEVFEQDELGKWAFVKCLENIGEAAYCLSDKTIEEFDEVDWRTIINARHMYVHHYFNLSWQRVWKTLTETDFISLRKTVDKIIRELKARL